MDSRRTMTMNWDALRDLEDDDDLFFDASSSSEEEFEDAADDLSNFPETQTTKYDMWIAPPESISDRRRRLLDDMGLGKDSGSSGVHGLLLHSRSDGSINTSSIDTKLRKEEMIGSESKQRLTRTISSGLSRFSTTVVGLPSFNKDEDEQRKPINASEDNNANNDDDGDGTKSTRQKESEEVSSDRKLKRGNSSFTKSFKKSKKKGAALFKNMRLGSIGASKTDKERSHSMNGNDNSTNRTSTGEEKPSSQWVKVRVHGKPVKEFTALHASQEIKGHEGSIWAMKFTSDGRFLATAGVDKVIRVWEVQEFDVAAMRGGDDAGSVSGTPVHPMAVVAGQEGRPPLPEAAPEKKKKGKKKKGVPDYVHVPETVFGLAETPFCALEGHLEDVLDLSWSSSRLLLSSSMDKTVRLWDLETKNCLKQFPHTDYVTCIQFNPADDDSFISGSLDAKVRIWNIPDQHVVDYIDLHEMVTAVSYSNDGKVSAVGSQKGICRFYNSADCKLEFKEQVELKTKKKPQPKKITGFQFSTCNPSQVLVTSADSRVRIFDGTKLIQKYKGYKNNNSQFQANYSPDGKYIISPSEDSQVYIWKHEEPKTKPKHRIIKSYEHFPCKEVSVTAPWPGISKLEQPLVEIHSKKHAKKSIASLPPPTAGSSPAHDDASHGKPSSSPLPPIPKRSTSNASTDNVEDMDHPAHADSCVGPCDSFSSATSSSGRFDMTSPSPSVMSSPGRGGSHGHKTIQATAWGFVIVTGGLGGEIKVFQNVGLPFKVGML